MSISHSIFHWLILSSKSQWFTQQKNKEKEVIEILDDSDDEDEGLFDNVPQFLLTGDPNDVFYNDEYFGLMEEDETIVIRAYRDDDDDTLLNEIRPKYIIMYDPNAAFVRRVEVGDKVLLLIFSHNYYSFTNPPIHR